MKKRKKIRLSDLPRFTQIKLGSRATEFVMVSIEGNSKLVALLEPWAMQPSCPIPGIYGEHDSVFVVSASDVRDFVRALADLEFPESFDERSYCIENPDVADAVSTQVFPSGLSHYISEGVLKGE